MDADICVFRSLLYTPSPRKPKYSFLLIFIKQNIVGGAAPLAAKTAHTNMPPPISYHGRAALPPGKVGVVHFVLRGRLYCEFVLVILL